MFCWICTHQTQFDFSSHHSSTFWYAWQNVVWKAWFSRQTNLLLWLIPWNFIFIKCFKPICFYLVAFFDWSVHYKVKMFALDFLDSDWWLLSWAEKLVPVLDGTYSAELILSVLGQLYKPQFSFLVRMPKCCLKSVIFASNQLAPMAYSLKFYSKKVSCQYVFI